MTSRRAARREAVEAILAGGKGVCNAIYDLLTWELSEAYTEMENAATNEEMWRSQGKCMEIRQLMTALKGKD